MQAGTMPSSRRPSSVGRNTFFAVAAANAIAVATKIVLNGGINPVLLLFIVTAISWLGCAQRTALPERRWIAPTTRTFVAVVGVLLLVGVLITPFPSYTEWIQSFVSGVNSEATHVSGLFTLIIGYFAAIIVPTGFTLGLIWPVLLIGLVLAFLGAVIFQSVLSFLLVFAIAAATITLLALRKTRPDVEATRSARVLLPATAGVIAIGLGLVFMHAPTTGSKNFVDNTLSPYLRRTVLAVNPGFPLLYDISRAGDEFKQKQLGGAPTLTSTPILEVQGTPGATVYIRTDVLDRYDGSSWSMSDRILHSGSRVRTLAPDAGNGDISRLSITPLVGNLDLVPMTLDTYRVDITGDAPQVVEGNFDTGIHLQYPLKRGETVNLLQSTKIADQLRPDFRALYLQLPEEIPEALRGLAQGLQRDTVTATLDNIQKFLAYNYSYNLSPDEPYAPNQDFVYSFLLSSKGGYCVQFATTFVILARLNGIPARYATGYLAYIPKDSDKVQVTELASHSWPEVWIDGRGWVTYEATTAVDAANYVLADGNFVYQYGIDNSPNTERQLQAILGHSVTAGNGSGSGRGVGILSRWFALLVAAVSAAAVAILAILWVRGVVNPFRRRGDRVYGGLRRLSLGLLKYGVPNPVKVGWSEWTENIAVRLNGNANAVREMSRFVVLNLYADLPLPPDAITRVRHTGRLIRRSIRETNGTTTAKPASQAILRSRE